jgi:hypothetical protein
MPAIVQAYAGMTWLLVLADQADGKPDEKTSIQKPEQP